MCSQTRNSCTKAFGNRSGSKNLKLKKSRGGQFDPPPLKASRVKVAVAPREREKPKSVPLVSGVQKSKTDDIFGLNCGLLRNSIRVTEKGIFETYFSDFLFFNCCLRKQTKLTFCRTIILNLVSIQKWAGCLLTLLFLTNLVTKVGKYRITTYNKEI